MPFPVPRVPRAQEALRPDAARHDAALYAKLAERAKRARSRARDGLSDQLLEDVADLFRRLANDSSSAVAALRKEFWAEPETGSYAFCQ
jgi:hypothetical protein